MKLYEALNIRKDEFIPVAIFAFQSFFLGTFLGTFDVGANTLFLQAFDDTMIPKAIVISGLTGILFTSLYAHFQNKLVFSRLAIFNLFFVFVLTFLLRAGYYFSGTKWLAFGLFVFMGPLNIVATVGFWGAVSRIFDLRQGKRLFGIIDMGQVLGVIISSWAVPFLIANSFSPINLIYISAFSAFFAFLLQIVINSKFSQQLSVKLVKQKSKSHFMDTMKIPYVRTMAYFVIFSMLVAFFVHFLFLAVADTRFSNNDELAKFLGGLMGTLTFVSILIKTFVYGPVMKNYGLKVSLLISPIIIALVSVSAALVGTFFGYTLASGAFTFFFLLISLGKLFQKALKDSIESPSLKMIYQSLDQSIRYEVQARVDGTINETAALTSGILLTILSLFSFIHLIHYIYFLVAIIVVWFFITIKLYKGYRNSLKETLEKSTHSVAKTSEIELLEQNVKDVELSKQLTIIQQSEPWELQAFIRDKLKSGESKEIDALLEKINEFGLTDLVPDLEQLKKRCDSSIAEKIDKTTSFLNKLIQDTQNKELILNLINSKSFEDRILAAKILGNVSDAELKNNLTFLLRDLVPSVKLQAIWASRKTNSKEIISFLIDFLETDKYAPFAHAALIGSGNTGLEMLELAFYRTNASFQFKQRILRIMPLTGSKSAPTTLFNHLSVKSNLNSTVISGLIALDFTATDKQILAVNKMLIEQAGICAWNLNAYFYCPPSSTFPNLKDQLNAEYTLSIHKLFDLLKLIYEKNSIEAVLENLEAGTGQSIAFAVELLDTFVEEDLKPYIVPLLEDTSTTNKLWALENYFPLRHYEPEELLKAILNRDNNILGKQTKIYALNAFQYLETKTVNADLIAQLFNTDKFLRHLSAQIIESIDKKEYISCKKRLKDKYRVELDRLMETSKFVNKNTIDTINFFKSIYPNINSRCLLFLVYNTSIIKVDKGELNNIDLFKGSNFILFVEQGKLTISENAKIIEEVAPGKVVNTAKYNPEIFKVETENNTILHYIELNKLIGSMYDNPFLIEYAQNLNI
ncbi:MAG: hypothetical protein H6537_10900 [Bacteroidales bacterium]|nr:hypothetical protein [Bacteroidales bacterium]HRX31866.1 hypothetical protein [Tenuifilaceae bacterium]